MQDTDNDGQLGNSSHGWNAEDRVNNELRKACEMSCGTGHIAPGTRLGGKDNNYVDPKVSPSQSLPKAF